MELDTNQIFVHYNIDGGPDYASIPMTDIGGNEFSAYIPGQKVVGTTVYYYISATDTSSVPNTGYHPLWAPITTNQFTIVEILPLLVVDALGNITNYTATLDSIGLPYDVASTEETYDMCSYANVIWVQGSGGPDQYARPNITTFLSNGGNLYINGQDIGSGAEIVGWLDWYNSTLHAHYIATDSGGTRVTGVPGDPITDGMVDYDIPSGSGLWPEEIAPYDGAASSIFTYDIGAKVGAIKVDTAVYKVVYIGFRYFEGTEDGQDNRDHLMMRILSWLDPSLQKPEITHTPLPSTESTSDYTATATIIDNNLVSQILYWSTDGVSFTPEAMANIGGDEYSANIPGQSWGTTVYYYIKVTDGDGNIDKDPKD
ncbi:MAG: hypothetical protein KAT70_02040, partial [Thermoplasmata archaeon]|nr:hypothetical protein [Thermoplasmata archaeon]